MPLPKKRIIAFLVLWLVPGLSFSGCALFKKQRMGQAAIKNFETRTIDAPFEDVYAAALEAFFDLGYTINHSDKESGIIVGEKRQKKPELWFLNNGKPGKMPGHDFDDILQLTLLVKPAGSRETKVRIKTALNKETKLDKKAIDEAWLYIERQVLMEEEPRKD